MFRKAYAFREIHYITAHSGVPVDYYVLRFPFIYFGPKAGDITTTDPQQFKEILVEQRARVNVVSHRLPLFTKSIDLIAISEGASFKAGVRRIPLGKVA